MEIGKIDFTIQKDVISNFTGILFTPVELSLLVDPVRSYHCESDVWNKIKTRIIRANAS